MLVLTKTNPEMEGEEECFITHYVGDDRYGMDSPDLDFVYDDADSLMVEIAELYNYTEGPEFQQNLKAFEEITVEFGMKPIWQGLDEQNRKSLLYRLLDTIDVTSKAARGKAARTFLYIAQGAWNEVQCDKEQLTWARKNVMMMYDCGVFDIFVEQLKMEIENGVSGDTVLRKPAVSIADSTELRIILSILYTMVEMMRVPNSSDTDEYKEYRECFKQEIVNPIQGELLAVTLLNMITKFCSGSAPHFPIKKVLLLLWKVLLLSLGGMEDMKLFKEQNRVSAGLPPAKEDTVDTTRSMRAASPPASATDLLETQNQNPNVKRAARPLRRSLMKQSSLDETFMELEETDDEINEIEERRTGDEKEEEEAPPSPEPRPQTPIPSKALPWTPKVRQKDIDQFLDNARIKFVGFPLQGDRESLAGLPEPLHEGINILKQHVYVSLSEMQIQREEDIAVNPISKAEDEIVWNSTEVLYQSMFPSLPQYMISLLKILLAAAPTSKTKSDSVNIMADVLPEEMPMTVFQSMKLGIDVNRHKEIIVKSISAILLLLLKHLKVNHVYQFEFLSQHLVFANCIPLVLKFFNQNTIGYVNAKNIIPVLDFPGCVLGEQPELTAESLEIGDSQGFCWRNLFSCVNLLRVLNKLTKWKHSRIMMLVVFKSAPILKRALKVKHALLQLYALKLLKMQSKYLGRQWRKSNMKTLSAIYQKVRHRLHDDWAFGNDLDARPWDFQAEEFALRECVDRFNSRRYDKSGKNKDPDLEPVDICIQSVLGKHVELTDEFKKHYDLWLQREVFQRSIDWDLFLSPDLPL